MKPFTYESPPTVDQALPLLRQGGWRGQETDNAARPLAGGTDLLTLMKADITAPARLVNVKRLDGLSAGISAEAGGLSLGALTTLAEIETSPLIQQPYAALAEAAAVAATPQLRNMATIGGNLLQRPRCWYFRNPHLACWLKGGDDCPAHDGENQLHALFGDSPCDAVHPSDLASVVHALEAEVHLRSAAGERTLPIGEFFAQPTNDRRTETTVRADELVLAVRLPPQPQGTRSIYLKAMDRKIWAFALVGVAAVLRVEGGRIAAARVTLSGVANVPWRAEAAERELLGATPSGALFASAAEAALHGAAPLAHNGYKVPLAKSLVRSALTALAGGAPVVPVQ